MQIPRFANATLRSSVVVAIALSVFGALTPTVARAGDDGDPWYFAVLDDVNQDGLGTSHSPLGIDKKFGPNDPRRVEVEPGFVTAGTNYTVRLRAFRPHEVVELRTYRYVPGCPGGRCWEWLHKTSVTMDKLGNADRPTGSSAKEVTDYRYCTTSEESCLNGFAELTVTPPASTNAGVLHSGPDTCVNGYVWREAFDGDHVCVTPDTRTQAALDNSQAAARRQPGGGAWGPNTCRQGYVWREASPSDLVCVTPDIRTQAAVDNRQAASRRVLG